MLSIHISKRGPRRDKTNTVITETKMLSFWRNFHHWLHWKLSFWQLSVQPVMKISSKWRHFRFSDRAHAIWYGALCCYIPCYKQVQVYVIRYITKLNAIKRAFGYLIFVFEFTLDRLQKFTKGIFRPISLSEDASFHVKLALKYIMRCCIIYIKSTLMNMCDGLARAFYESKGIFI